MSHHGLIGRRQVGWVQRPWAVDGDAIDGTEGRMGEVQVQASVRGNAIYPRIREGTGTKCSNM